MAAAEEAEAEGRFLLLLMMMMTTAAVAAAVAEEQAQLRRWRQRCQRHGEAATAVEAAAPAQMLTQRYPQQATAASQTRHRRRRRCRRCRAAAALATARAPLSRGFPAPPRRARCRR